MIKKLINIQGELKAPKGQTNNFGKYKYRSCEDILEAVKPLLVREELLMTISDEIVEVSGRVYVKATVSITNGSDKFSVSGWAREAETKKGMDDSQITGAASSYARKYALNAMFLIDDTKDSDSTNTHGKEPKKDSCNKSTEPPEDPYDKVLPDSEKEYYLNHPALSDKQKTYLTGHNLTEALKYKIDEQIAGVTAGQKEIIY